MTSLWLPTLVALEIERHVGEAEALGRLHDRESRI